MSRTCLDLLSTSRVRSKMIAYFATAHKPVGVRELSRYIHEDNGAVGRYVMDFERGGLLTSTKGRYALASDELRPALQVLSVPIGRSNARP